MTQQFRIGIVGGMGPMTDVLLQQLIHEATPVTRDQDHIPVICYTNPQIPDRTESLRSDGGASFAAAIAETARAVETAGASVIVVPCNTAHARLPEIQAAVQAPVLDMIATTVTYVTAKYPAFLNIGVLATTGTRNARIYDDAFRSTHRRVLSPSGRDQHHLMELIYAVKARQHTDADLVTLRLLIESLKKEGAELVILGCTELSLLYQAIVSAPCPIVDPLRVVADTLVRTAREKGAGTALTGTRARGTLAAG